jgi:ketosteroid isomerase-like protein
VTWPKGTRPGSSEAIAGHRNPGGPWTREEIEREFARYRERGAAGDWDAWADQFTEDALYVEHEYGEFHGREAIRAWIKDTMGTWPGSAMPEFPVDWYVIDEAQGWVVAKIWNRMADPGDGSVHQEYNFTLLRYAGDGMWCYEEDVYNPAHFGTMIAGYLQAGGTAGDRS